MLRLLRLSLVSSLLALLMTSFLFAQGQAPLKVFPLATDVLLFDKGAMVPVSPLAVLIGASVKTNNTVTTISRGTNTFTCTLDSTAAQQNAKPLTLPVAPHDAGGVRLVPIEALITSLGGTVNVDRFAHQAVITIPGGVEKLTLNAIDTGRPLQTYRYSQSELYMIESNGTNLRRLSYTNLGVTIPTLSPDGTSCLTIFDKTLYMRNIFSTNSKPLLKLEHNDDYATYTYGPAVFSPDGKHIACVVDTLEEHGFHVSHVCIIDADGSSQRLLMDGTAPIYSPDGKFLACNGNAGQNIYLMNADGSNPQKITNASAPRFSPDGTALLYLSDGPNQTQFVTVRILTGPNAGKTYIPNPELPARVVESAPCFTPDGQRIIFTEYTIEENDIYFDQGLYSMKLDHTDIQRYELYMEAPPVFSPRGSMVACIRDEQLCLLDEQQDNTDTKLPAKDLLLTQTDHIAFSPDGKFILFTAQQRDRNRP